MEDLKNKKNNKMEETLKKIEVLKQRIDYGDITRDQITSQLDEIYCDVEQIGV